MKVERRVAGWEDADWLFGLHEAAMRARAEAIHGPWDRQWQREHFESRDPGNTIEILVLGDQPVGAIHWRDVGDSVYLELIEVQPERQGEGVGGAAIRSLHDEAAAMGKTLSLRVNRNNRAQHLYARLGFEVEHETENHLHMVLRRF